MFRFELETYKENALIPITKSVRDAIKKSEVKDGLAVVYCPHTTAGITINENADPDVAKDLITAMNAIVPDVRFHHGEGNSPAHLKTLLTGASVTIPISDGEPVLGIWQGVYFCEYDGPRQRKYFVQIVSG
ncbi:MAG: secondary thiamine-phosphate synthase enzyme YjbQ [Christensenellaceae bacterium]|jgi:secondary thiamine-phosphate synthase enzyme